MRDRFFCRRNLVCFEACSVCEVCGDWPASILSTSYEK